MKLIKKNKKAFFNFEVLDSVEVGIVLNGNEVKSIRAGNISLDDAYATIHGGEVQLLNCFIAPYSHAYSKKDESRRSRKLLLHKKEINKLIGDMSKKGITLIPIKIYFNERSYIKLEIGLCKHKKAHSKKRELREKDIKREAEREMKGKLK